MRVRHKRLWKDQKYDWQVIEESPGFYVGTRNLISYADEPVGNIHALDKKDYEPVTEEQWVDVTETCTELGIRSLFVEPANYRLRKVYLSVKNDKAPLGVEPRHAFIIERKTS
jgi:hypothetical protein